MRFKTIVREIEAEQWYPDRNIPGIFIEDPYKAEREVYEPELPIGLPIRYFVVTIHNQRAYLNPGDWIVPESDGIHHYPITEKEMPQKYIPI